MTTVTDAAAPETPSSTTVTSHVPSSAPAPQPSTLTVAVSAAPSTTTTETSVGAATTEAVIEGAHAAATASTSTADLIRLCHTLWDVVLPQTCRHSFCVAGYEHLLRDAGRLRPGSPPPPPPAAPRDEDVGAEVCMLGTVGEAFFPLAGLCARNVARSLATWASVSEYLMLQSDLDDMSREKRRRRKHFGRDLTQQDCGEQAALSIFSSMGLVKMVGWMLTHGQNLPSDGWGSGFTDAVVLNEAIRKGKVNVLRYMMSRSGIHPLTLAERYDLLYHLCFRGDTSMCQWLIDSCGIAGDNLRPLKNKAFRIACSNGHFTMAQWLATLFSLTPEDVRSKENCALRKSCSGGYLNIVQWLVTQFGLTVDDAVTPVNEIIGTIYYACRGGHFDVVRWLVSTFSLTNVPRCGVDALMGSSIGGHLEMAKWLFTTFSMERVDISCLNESCAYGHLEMAKWLCDKVPVKKTDDLSEMLYHACREDHFEVAKWLHENFTIPSDSHFLPECLEAAYNAKNLPLLKWLVSTFPMPTAIDPASYLLGYFWDNDNFEIVEWFTQHFTFPPDTAGGLGTIPELPILQYALKTFSISHSSLRRTLRSLMEIGALDCISWLNSVEHFTADEMFATKAVQLFPHVLQWVVTQCPPSDIIASHFSESLIGVCQCGNTCLASWLIDQFHMIHKKPNKKILALFNDTITKAFVESCQVGNIKTCEWLLEKFGNKLDKKRDQTTAFKAACEYGHLRLAQLLSDRFSISKPRVAEESFCAFRRACQNSHLHVAMWLTEKYNLTADEVKITEAFLTRKCAKRHSFTTLLWLEEYFNMHTTAPPPTDST